MLKDLIKTKRPNISDNSLNNYIQCLTKIKRDLNYDGDLKDSKFLRDYDEIKKYIDNQNKLTTKKNKLTCVIVGIDADKKFKNKDALLEKYQKYLKDLTDEYNTFLKKQVKTTTQAKNWIDYEDLANIANDLMKKVKRMKNRDKLEKHELNDLQNAILLKTHLEFPIRNDLCEVIITTQEEYDELSDEEKEKNNWLIKDGKKMKYIFNNFKNSKKIGSKEYDVPKNLVNLYNVWFKHNKSKYMLVSKKNYSSKISSNSQTKYFNELFQKYFPEKKISSSLIRHIVISHFTKGEPSILEEEKKEKEIEDKYLHSADMNRKYRKID